MIKEFTIDNYTISDFLADYMSSWGDTTIKEIKEGYEEIEDDDQWIKKEHIDISFLDHIPDNWVIKCESGDHVHDGDNADYTITITDPITGNYYIGGDNHNLCVGWSDVVMTYYEYDPTKHIVEISMEELNKLRDDSKFLKLLEEYGVDNWHGYQDAQKEMYDYDE